MAPPVTIPAPYEEGIPFALYDALHSSHSSYPKSLERQMEKTLSQSELEQKEFTTERQALIAFIRAMALSNTLKKLVQPNPDMTNKKVKREQEIYNYCQPKAYLLEGRAALHLAALYYAQALGSAGKLNPKSRKLAKTVRGVLLQKMKGPAGSVSLSRLSSYSMDLAAKHTKEPLAKAQVLVNVAFMCVSQVARDETPVGPDENKPYIYMYNSARPAMAEAWFAAAEVDLLHAEMEAFLEGDQASGTRPECFRAPFHDEEEEEDWDGWDLSIPLMVSQQDKHQTYLGPHWWGQPAPVALRLLRGQIMTAQQNHHRYSVLTHASHNHALHDELYPRERALLFELERRSAAALANFDLATQNPQATPKYKETRHMVNELRKMFPGTLFEPTNEFVRSLEIDEHEWQLSSMHGGLGGGSSRTMLKVTDCDGRYRDFIIASKLVEDMENPDCLYTPPPDVLYDLLLRCMAGSGHEERAHVGPPRRPKPLVLSYRLRASFAGLKELLKRVDVECVLDSKENLQFACSNHHTDFETGHPIEEEDAAAKSTVVKSSSLIGQFVGIHGLKSRHDLNGRVGRVWKWHEDQQRWEVELIAILDSERPSPAANVKPGHAKNTIGIKPENLMTCPQHGFAHDLEGYLAYKDELRNWDSFDDNNQESLGPVLERLQGLILGGKIQGGDLCVICQQDITGNANASTEFDFENANEMLLGQGVQLPCQHFFHLTCLLKWIKPDRAECPCCRKSI